MKANSSLRIVAICIVCLFATGLSRFECNSDSSLRVPHFSRFDFTANDGNYNLKWHKKNKDTLAFADVETYTIDLQLPNPADFPYDFTLYVMTEGSGDPIGSVHVSIPLGATSASFVYASNAGAKRAPTGAPDLTDGKFWLGCTTVYGNLRGNAGKITKTNANVYLETDGNKTPSHSITCAQ